MTAYTSAPNNQFTVELRDGATTPGAVLESYSVTLAGFSLVDLTSSLHPVLNAGTGYWVAVITPSAGGAWGWGGVDRPIGTVDVIGIEGGAWSPFIVPPVYVPGLEVSGTAVPEPATSGAFFALVVILFLNRRAARNDPA
nr:PEP-CTERM sorting domain-containing protein [uncultured Paludibaculum sp.]